MKKKHYEKDKLYRYYKTLFNEMIKYKRENNVEFNTDVPFSLQINLLNSCYQKCIGCRKPDWPDVMLSEDKVYDIIDWMAFDRCGDSIVYSGGDPMRYKNFPDILEYTKNVGIATGVLTAGLWNEKTFDIEKFMKNVDWISVSIDGADVEMYTKTRGVNTLDTVCKNIEKMNKLKSPDVRIRCNATISNMNVHQIPQILDLCRELRIECNFYPIHTWDDLKINNIDRVKLKELVNIAFLRNKTDSLNKQVNTNVSDFINLMDRSQPNICIIPFVHAFVDANGDIMHCCRLINDNGDFVRDKTAVLGNVNIENINEIMNSERARKITNKTVAAMYDCCKECDRYNKLNENFYDWILNSNKVVEINSEEKPKTVFI